MASVSSLRDFDYEGLFSDDARWCAKEKYRYVELSNYLDNNKKPDWKDGEGTEDELVAWIKRNENAGDNDSTFHTNIILLRGDLGDVAGTGRVQCSRMVYEAIQHAWPLPACALRVMMSPGVSAFFGNEDKTGLAIQLAGPRCGGCIVLHDKSKRYTHMLVESRTDDFEEGLLERLKAVEEASHIPMLFPLTVLQLEHCKDKALYTDLFERIAGIRIALDFDPFWHERIPDRMEDYSDLAKVTTELTKMAQEVAQLKSNLEGNQELVGAVYTVHEEYRKALQDPLRAKATPFVVEVDHRLRFLATQIRELQRQLDVQVASIQAQVQTVYSLTGSRDNHLNYQSAEAARRDSSDMRVIAWVTLGFLPATFVATVCSTTFFDWQAPTWPRRVSKLIWIYWAFSVGLTVCVIIAWRFTSHEMKNKAPGQDGSKKDSSSRKAKTESLYDEDGDRVHWHELGPHELGGVIEMGAKTSLGSAATRGQGLGASHVVGGAVETV